MPFHKGGIPHLRALAATTTPMIGSCVMLSVPERTTTAEQPPKALLLFLVATSISSAGKVANMLFCLCPPAG